MSGCLKSCVPQRSATKHTAARTGRGTRQPAWLQRVKWHTDRQAYRGASLACAGMTTNLCSSSVPRSSRKRSTENQVTVLMRASGEATVALKQRNSSLSIGKPTIC